MLPTRRQLVSHSFVLIVGLAVGLVATVNFFNQSVTTRPVSPTASTSATTKTQIGQSVTGAELTPEQVAADQDKIMKYLTVEGALLGINDNFSLYFKNLNTKEEVGIDSSKSWIPASTIKSYVVLEAFHQRDLGTLSFDQVVTVKAQNVVPTELETDDFPRLREGTTATVRQLLEAMIEQSDNTAYNSLLDILDRRNINATLRRLSLTETVVGEKLNLDDNQLAIDLAVPGRQPNTTTAKDLATFFDLLYQRAVPDSDEMMAIFKKQKINNMIPDLLPSGTVVAHKTGDWAPIYHDGGVVYKPSDPFILTIFSSTGDPAVIAKLAQVAYFRSPEVIGKEVSLNFEKPSTYQSIALSEPVAPTKVLAEQTPASLTANDLGITAQDLTDRGQFVRQVGFSLILPGSVFYGPKKWLEGLGLTLARSNRQKAEAYLNQALSRLSEAKTLIRSGRSADAGVVLAESEKELELSVSAAKLSPDKDVLLTRAKEVLDLHYSVLKDISVKVGSRDQSNFVDAVYNFYQQEHRTLTPQVGKTTVISPVEQVPLVGSVIDLNGEEATVKLEDGTEKAITLTPEVNVREANNSRFESVSSVHTGDRIAVVGSVSGSGKVISRFILRKIPTDIVQKHEGIVTEINPGQRTIGLLDNSGQTQVVTVSPDTQIRSKDTDVSLEGIKAGSAVTVYGVEAAPVAESKVASPSAAPAKTQTAEKPKPIKAHSVTVTVNSGGKKETKKSK